MRPEDCGVLAAGELDRFQCHVPDDDRPGHNLGREFDTLLCFLPRYRDATGEELFVVEKREGPDFRVERVAGTGIGIEITDAPIQVGQQPNLYAERRAQSKLEDLLHPILRQRGESIEFQDSNSWSERLTAVGRIDEHVRAAPLAPARVELENNGLRISAELGRSESPRVEDGAWGDVSSDLGETVKARIRNKLERANPAIRPCILVVYPIYIAGVMDLGAIARNLRGQLSSTRISTHFDEVWLCNAAFAERLWPDHD